MLQKYHTFFTKKSQKTVDFWLKPPYNSNTMKRTTITLKLERTKRRAIELYHADSPFRAKVVESKKVYKRREKHQKQVDKDLDQ